MSKYELHSAEEQYQPGSGERVLANKPGIIYAEEIEVLESGLLLMLYEHLFMGSQPQPTGFSFLLIALKGNFLSVLAG